MTAQALARAVEIAKELEHRKATNTVRISKKIS
jgi:hypothetical protein